MINVEDDSNIIKDDIECTINNITRQNYILNCKTNETFKCHLEGSISFFDNGDILLINFADYNSSLINIEKSTNHNLFFSKNKNKLGVGAIIGIIIPIIVVIGLIILLLAYFC